MFIDSTNAYPSERWEIEAKHLQKSFGQHEGRNVGDASWKTKNRMGYSLQRCCVEAECHFCYLRESSVYVHESCCLGYQRHPLTYVGPRRFRYGPRTKYGS